MVTSRFVSAVVSTAAITFAVGPVHGQAYPSKPIRIFTATAGGSSDFISRLLGRSRGGDLEPNICRSPLPL